MPSVNVLFWNIQNFGEGTGYRARQSRLYFIAQTVFRAGADILFIEELKQAAINGGFLNNLQLELNSLPAPYNNWYFDWIKGSLRRVGRPPNYPYNTAADLWWDDGHHEGYAMFWNQNIAKFAMQAAPPIQPPPVGGVQPIVPNSQSEGTSMQGIVVFGATPTALPGCAIPAGGLQVPNNNQAYVLPENSVIGGHILVDDIQVAPGTVIPAQSSIAAPGVRLSTQTNATYPVVIPGNYTLTDALTLPAGNAVVVPKNLLSLVMFGRDSSDPNDPTRRPDTATGNISGTTIDFAPNAANFWNWIYFTQSRQGAASLQGCRRPVYATIKVNRTGFAAAADVLVPLIVYHAPSASPASTAGMQRSAYSQVMYQVYDWGANAWVDCNNTLIGGDFNSQMDGPAYGYNAFLNAWGPPNWYAGGAGATMAVSQPPGGNPDPANPLNRSSVVLRYGARAIGDPIYSANINDYRRASFDNAFYRGLGAVQANNTLLIDLLTASFNGGTLTGVPVRNCLNTPNMIGVTDSVIHNQVAVAPNMVSPLTSLFELQAGAFGTQPNYNAQNTQARRVGEFVNLFVSDHLPVAVGFNM